MAIHHDILLVLALQFAMILLYMLSQELNVSYPIFLMIGGLLIGILPGVPRTALHPDIAFLDADQRRGLPTPQPDPVHYLHRHSHHACLPGTVDAASHPMAEGKKDHDEHIPEEQQLAEIRLRMAKLSLNHLNSRYANDVVANARLNGFYRYLQSIVGNAQLSLSDEAQAKEYAEMKEHFNRIYRDLTTERRNELERIRRENVYDSEILREYEYLLDLEEARMRI